MREIKFRAWDNEDKKMYKVVRIAKSIYGYCECYNLLICDLEADEQLKETDIRYSYDYELMQYVGIKDKEGKEIYEGDIAIVNDKIFKIVYSKGSFVIYNGNSNIHLIYDLNIEDNKINNMEVMGNIYENPELLGE